VTRRSSLAPGSSVSTRICTDARPAARTVTISKPTSIPRRIASPPASLTVDRADVSAVAPAIGAPAGSRTWMTSVGASWILITTGSLAASRRTESSP
jgi:hypothetical protein